MNDEWARLDRALAELRRGIVANRWPLGVYFASVYLIMLAVVVVHQMFVGW